MLISGRHYHSDLVTYPLYFLFAYKTSQRSSVSIVFYYPIFHLLFYSSFRCSDNNCTAEKMLFLLVVGGLWMFMRSWIGKLK